jgi:putative tryptophan/tyrosine transport system substrate-binding protein
VKKAGGWRKSPVLKPAMPVIGFLSSASPDAFGYLVAAFLRGLNDAGYIESQNVVIEYRWAEFQYDRLPALASELVRRPVTVIVASGGVAPTVAAKAATTTIPIVFTTGTDPVNLGLVTSLAWPGGNSTGVSLLTGDLGAKRLELLHETLPKAAVIAVILNPSNSGVEAQLKNVQDGARALGQQLHVLHASSEREIEAAFTTLVQMRIGALVVGSDAFFTSRRDQFVALATRHAVAAIYEWREFAEADGLMSYGTSLADAYRQVGIYTGRILKGEKPADLPVQQSVKVELVINLKTARALGLTVPLPLLGRADEVIE